MGVSDIQAEIRRLGIKQNDVAREMGVSIYTLSRFLTGKQAMSWETESRLRAVVRLLGSAEIAAQKERERVIRTGRETNG